MEKLLGEVTNEQLIDDFKVVVADAEALLKATASQGGEKVAEIRAKAEESLRIAKAKMAEAQAGLLVKTREGGRGKDVEGGRAHVLSLLVLALAALFFIGVGVVLAAILLVVAFWDSHRLLALGSLAGFFLAAGVGAWAYALHKARTEPQRVAASLSGVYKGRKHAAP